MSRERWIRNHDEAGALDWRRQSRELDVPLDVARPLYLRAMEHAVNVRRAETLYLSWLRAAAATYKPVALPSVPGRRTQVLHGRNGLRTPTTDGIFIECATMTA